MCMDSFSSSPNLKFTPCILHQKSSESPHFMWKYELHSSSLIKLLGFWSNRRSLLGNEHEDGHLSIFVVHWHHLPSLESGWVLWPVWCEPKGYFKAQIRSFFVTCHFFWWPMHFWSLEYLSHLADGGCLQISRQSLPDLSLTWLRPYLNLIIFVDFPCSVVCRFK